MTRTDNALSQLVGARARQVREHRGWSLQEVETKSGQQFKASVMGAYERGERGLSVRRLFDLAGFYGVRVLDLLPPDEEPTTVDGWLALGDRLLWQAKTAFERAREAVVIDRIKRAVSDREPDVDIEALLKSRREQS